MLTLIISSILRSTLSGCPDADLLYPCTCHHSIFGTHVYCGGDSPINLENIFDSLSTGLEADKKHFNHLTIANSAVHQLNANTFRDITFESILIENCLNLSEIHRNAFTETNWFTKSFSIKNCLQLKTPSDDFFYILSKLKNLEILLIFNSNITEIPSNAFKPINGYQKQLKTIDINSKTVGKIGENSFRYLNSLENISLVNTSIDFIADNVFTPMIASNTRFVINFVNNSRLNEKSFSKKSFSSISRPTQLTGIKANVLKEEIFFPFLTASPHNSIELSDQNQIDCNNCQNYWLRKNSQLLSKVLGIKCSNGYNLMHNNNFFNCVHPF